MKEFEISKKEEGKKLYGFIKKILPGLKNNEIFKLIRKKVISVNSKKQTPDYILKKDDIINIYLADEHFDRKGKKNKFWSVNKDIDIIFEDDHLLVINKPSGILVHPDKGEYKNTIYETARAYLYSKGEYDPDDSFSPTLCHRLDRNTSGLLIIAKDHSTLQNITEQFRDRQTKKTYLTIVSGEVKDKALLVSLVDQNNNVTKIVDLRVLKNIPSKNKFLKDDPSISATLVIPKITKKDLSLITVELWTGKKHQIRAHLKSYRHPLIGDQKYFNDSSVLLSKKYNVNTYFLHSYRLKVNGYDEWEAPLPEEFTNKISEIF